MGAATAKKSRGYFPVVVDGPARKPLVFSQTSLHVVHLIWLLFIGLVSGQIFSHVNIAKFTSAINVSLVNLVTS
jgi:hypothetical protein